jgi:hypothetical protein
MWNETKSKLEFLESSLYQKLWRLSPALFVSLNLSDEKAAKERFRETTLVMISR